MTDSESSFSWPITWALPHGVHALCTTRLGGVSQPPFNSFNLGDHVQDDPRAVAQNRSLLEQQLAPASAVFLKQVHGVNCIELSAQTAHGTTADACWTSDTEVACTIMVADCLPLLFVDEGGCVVGAAHAGWRGLAAGVVEKTLEAVCAAAGVQARQVKVWLGPCIGAQAFEVGQDVLTAFKADAADPSSTAIQYFKTFVTGKDKTRQKWLFDLAGMARCLLQQAGVVDISGNDSSAEWCTVSQKSRFFSYRRDGVTGRFAVCIWRGGR